MVRAAQVTHADRRTTPLTLTLIGVNAVIWILGVLVPDLGDRIFENGAQFRPYIVARGEWWRGLTAMFLHAQDYPFHILFNMWALWVFGPVLERRWGTVPFGALYLASGLGGAALFHLLGSLNPAVGASGAIFGLFGALLIASYRQRHTIAGRAIFTQLAILLAINLSLPLLYNRIAWEAHVGGLIAGIAIAFAWDHLGAGRRAALQRTLVGVAVAAVGLGVLILA